MIITKGDTITIVIDNEEVEDYLEYYFRKFPRKKKPPIKEPIHPSVNIWGNMNRQAKNNLKQDWNDFIVWMINKYKLNELNIQKCSITYKYFFKTKHRRDLLNFCCKFVDDGLVNSGFLKDDNLDVIDPVMLTFGGYSKDNPRMEITVERKDIN